MLKLNKMLQKSIKINYLYINYFLFQVLLYFKYRVSSKITEIVKEEI